MRLEIDLPVNNRIGEVGAKLILESVKALPVTHEEKKEILEKIAANMQK